MRHTGQQQLLLVPACKSNQLCEVLFKPSPPSSIAVRVMNKDKAAATTTTKATAGDDDDDDGSTAVIPCDEWRSFYMLGAELKLLTSAVAACSKLLHKSAVSIDITSTATNSSSTINSSSSTIHHPNNSTSSSSSLHFLTNGLISDLAWSSIITSLACILSPWKTGEIVLDIPDNDRHETSGSSSSSSSYSASSAVASASSIIDPTRRSAASTYGGGGVEDDATMMMMMVGRANDVKQLLSYSFDILKHIRLELMSMVMTC